MTCKCTWLRGGHIDLNPQFATSRPISQASILARAVLRHTVADALPEESSEVKSASGAFRPARRFVIHILRGEKKTRGQRCNRAPALFLSHFFTFGKTGFDRGGRQREHWVSFSPIYRDRLLFPRSGRRDVEPGKDNEIDAVPFTRRGCAIAVGAFRWPSLHWHLVVQHNWCPRLKMPLAECP